jgi:hypothetical protein
MIIDIFYNNRNKNKPEKSVNAVIGLLADTAA